MRAVGALVLAALALVPAAPAGAATMVARNARYVAIKVDAHGVALVSYHANGTWVHFLAWGAHNARPPDAARPGSQVRFHTSYSGGYGTVLGTGYWRKVAAHNACRAYAGPQLWHMIAACTAPDGTNWAVQSWQADLHDNGWATTGVRVEPQIFLSHWSGALPKLWFKADWTYAGAQGGPFDLVYGQFTYAGHPVYGFSSTSLGAPTDSFGRLIALDTHNPPWSTGYHQAGGWWRQNAFLVHRPYGDFCAGVYRKILPLPPRTHPGRGDRYRIVANGPGVTPLVEWENAPPGYYRAGLGNLFASPDARGPYDPALDAALNADQRQLDPVPSRPSSCYHTH